MLTNGYDITKRKVLRNGWNRGSRMLRCAL